MIAGKRAAGFAAALCLLLVLLCAVPAHAADDDDRFQGKTWDEVVEVFLSERGIDPEKVALGYRNTVTGEEHFLNGDIYHMAASMQKVPLNMVYTERVRSGEMTLNERIDGYPYAKALELTIVNSDNDLAYRLWMKLGGFREYRSMIVPYMTDDPDSLDPIFFRDNYFTARQMIHCLNLLQTESERFPGLIGMMRLAEPKNYFNYHEQSYEIAHKYGYLKVLTTQYINDCAIVYTDEPIVIVMFTLSLPKPYDALADYCSLMADYAQYHTELRRVEEAQVTPSPSPSPSPVPTAAPTPTPTLTPTASPAPVLERDAEALPVVAAVAAAAAILLFACAAVFFRGRRHRK